jgi:uncharacterized protein YndB with AHSA1/START domain
MNPNDIKTTDVVVSRHIAASPPDVFDAWLDPKSPASMWSDAEQLVFEGTEGSIFYWLVENDGSHWPHFGRFLIVDRTVGRIEHTFMSPFTQGLETSVAITLAASGGGTDFRLVHAGLPDDENGRRHEQGWGYFVERLSTGLAQRTHA